MNSYTNHFSGFSDGPRMHFNFKRYLEKLGESDDRVDLSTLDGWMGYNPSSGQTFREHAHDGVFRGVFSVHP